VLPEQQVNIAIFASGAGSNAGEIIKRFSSHQRIRIALIVCNKPGAGVLQVAANAGIEWLLIERERFNNGDAYLPELQVRNIDFIVLAGFLWKVPEALIDAFPRRIINIHPALLPSYGGKGMYGEAVHKAVLNASEKHSGITIHYVDGHYDNGDIIFQAKCPVDTSDTPASLAQKIHRLEHKHFPGVIEKILVQTFDLQ
jgi:phosphoribosylglycinamide formyltransferase 1